jgi:hypothetical protein
MGLSSFRKSVASLGTTAAMSLVPQMAAAGEQSNHAVLGTEVSAHSLMAYGGYFHEAAHHLSIGVSGGLGKDFHGGTVGALEGLIAYHKTLSRAVAHGVFGVLEAGGGAEMDSGEHGVHFEPIAKATGLVGIQVSEALGIFAGPNYVATPDTHHWSISAGAVFGF